MHTHMCVRMHTHVFKTYMIPSSASQLANEFVHLCPW